MVSASTTKAPTSSLWNDMVGDSNDEDENDTGFSDDELQKKKKKKRSGACDDDLDSDSEGYFVTLSCFNPIPFPLLPEIVLANTQFARVMSRMCCVPNWSKASTD